MEIIKIFRLNENHNKIIVLFLLLCSFSIPLFIFKGSIDDFVPKHIAVIDEIIYRGYMPENYYTIQIPGFYILGAILTMLTGLPAKELVWFPVQIVPYEIIFFVLMYKLSRNYIIAGLITLTDLISGTTGTARVFFWPHGLGYILFYVFIHVLLDISKNVNDRITNVNKPYYHLLIIIIGSSLVFISYNLTAMCLIFLLVVAAFLYMQSLTVQYKEEKFKYIWLSKRILTLLIVMSVVELGLSKFFYNTFIPTIKASQLIELSGIEKFLLYYISPKPVDTLLKDLYLEYPMAISIISGIKYLLLLTSIVMCLGILLHKLWAKEKFNYVDISVVSITIMMLFYSIFRLMIGGIVVTSLYLPGVVCTLWLFRYSKNLRAWSAFVVLLILILVPIYYYIHYSNNLLNRDTDRYETIVAVQDWFLEKGFGSSSIISDELTKNLLLLNQVVKTKSYEDSFKQYKAMTSVDAASLIGSSGNVSPNTQFVLNYRLNSMSLNNWIIIKSWRYYKDVINDNKIVNKSYDNNSIAVYSLSF